VFGHFVMPTDFRVGAVIVGALLLLIVLLSDARPARWLAGVLGAALIAGALASNFTPVAAPVPDTAAQSAAPGTPPAPVDVLEKVNSGLAACTGATAPELPDGAVASLQQMQAATQAFKAYDAATAAYTNCVDATVTRVTRQFAGVASEADLHRAEVFATSAHNTAVDQEQALADKLNAQVRIYKARHPG
jgi:hypothetical protein